VSFFPCVCGGDQYVDREGLLRSFFSLPLADVSASNLREGRRD
jgi:hypothetical protein